MALRVPISEVQGNVLRHYGSDFPCVRFVFVKPKDAGAAPRRAIARWLRDVSFGWRPKQVPDPKRPHLNVAFTFRGLEQLDVAPDVLYAFPKAFRAGAHDRARGLGDSWQDRDDLLDLRESHVMLAIHAGSREECESWWGDNVEPFMDRFEQVHLRDAGFPDGGNREAFGFADGRSQPAIEGVDVDPVGDGVYARLDQKAGTARRRLSMAAENLGFQPVTRGWRNIRTGEFLLGHQDEDGVLPQSPPTPLGPNGTFMVYREMEQHVERFHDYTRKWARKIGLSQHELEAKIVGRWQDGIPVAQWPSADGGGPPNRRRANDFLYGDDARGFGCPLGAHVRRANPRDALSGGAERTMRHRIIRRGVPYDAGLVFICFNASIANGFEFIQKHWINDGHAFGLGPDPDFLLQQREGDEPLAGKIVIQGSTPSVLQPPDDPFVTVRGCEYLFVPSRSACAWLAGTHLAT